MGTPTGAPNFDDKVGVQELQFSVDELARAERGQTIVKSLHINGDGGRYELTFEARNSNWVDWFPLPGQAVFDRDKQHVAAVSRAPGNLDLFVIGLDNHIWSTFWNA